MTAVLPVCAGAVTFENLTIPPEDSIDARLLKIWVPVEGTRVCEVEIDITDGEGAVVRHLLGRRLNEGYYNIYWDKKDDSGQYVPKGEYKYVLRSCPRKEINKLYVRYTKGENSCLIKKGDDLNRPFFDFTILDDSVRVSLEVVNRIDKPIEVLFSDSLMSRGDYRFVWEPDSLVLSGQYIFKLKVEDFTKSFMLRYFK